MRTLIGVLFAGGLAILAAAGCTTTDSDARLASIEAELRALWAEVAELKAQGAKPAAAPAAPARTAAGLERLPGASADPEMLEKLRILNDVSAVSPGAEKEMKDLKERIGKLEDRAKTVESIKGDVEKIRGDVEKLKNR